MLLDGKACHPATFAHTNLLTILRYLNCCQTLYSITTDLGLVFPALFISGTHKVAGLNLTVGRSRDQVLQRAKITFVPSSSTSSIISRSSSSVGFCPSDLMTVPSSDDEIDPPPSLSNKMNASLSSEMKYTKSKTRYVAQCDTEISLRVPCQIWNWPDFQGHVDQSIAKCRRSRNCKFGERSFGPIPE